MKFKRIATIDGLAIEDILTYDIINIIQIKKRYYHHVRKYDKLIEIDKELVNKDFRGIESEATDAVDWWYETEKYYPIVHVIKPEHIQIIPNLFAGSHPRPYHLVPINTMRQKLPLLFTNLTIPEQRSILEIYNQELTETFIKYIKNKTLPAFIKNIEEATYFDNEFYDLSVSVFDRVMHVPKALEDMYPSYIMGCRNKAVAVTYIGEPSVDTKWFHIASTLNILNRLNYDNFLYHRNLGMNIPYSMSFLSPDLRFVVTSFNTYIKHGAHLEVLFKALLNHGYVYPTHPRVPKWVIEKRLNKNIVHYRDVFAWVYVDSGDMRKKFDSKVIPVEKIIKNALKPDKVN